MTNVDPWLQLVVASSIRINDSTDRQIENDITLHVGGLLVSGNIISGRDFLMSYPQTDKMQEWLDKLEKPENTPVDKSSEDLPEFIHLSGARFFIPGNPPIPTDDDRVFWRGRISEVSGFHFGILKVGAKPA
jgi:hypothetical protein